MARVYFSGLVNTVRGRVSYSVLSAWKGVNVIKRHNPGPHQPRSEKQQQIRGWLSDLAGEWYSLSDAAKDLWKRWVAMAKWPMSGINAFILFNMRAQKYFPGKSRMVVPPPTPNTPGHVQGFAVSAKTGSDFSVTWTAPTLSTLYVIADYWAMPGKNLDTSPRWTFGATAGADAGFLDITTTYPAGTVLKFRVRTIDDYQRVSPWSHILEATAIT
ncbi:MAG TPA: hypothetical protein EYP09_08905 [Anaerolineae bacterium]|nr:hypothetical protein [Anaerolineae bacterium]